MLLAWNKLTNLRLNRIYKLMVTGIIVSILTACSAFPPAKKNTVIPSNKAQLEQWTIRGKILMTANNEKYSGYFYWRQQHDEFYFSVNSFIGSNILTLEHKDDLATLEFDGKNYSDQSASQLLFKLTGSHLPVEQFPVWLTGQVTGEELNTTLAANGLPNKFIYKTNNETWTVRYQQQHQVGSLTLPKTISYQSAKSKVKMSISEWEL